MIATKINAEITQYREKFFLGLSIRQLICFAAAILASGATALVGTRLLHINIDLLGYIIMLVSLPFLAAGFIRRNGYPFEKYAAIFCRWSFGQQKLYIQHQKECDLLVPAHKKDGARLGELPYAHSTKSRKKRTAAARKDIAAAKKELRALKRSLRQKSREAARA